ncbi:MAG: hypothetical protein R3B13_02405 [Polyangiaceae bacterium]
MRAALCLGLGVFLGSAGAWAQKDTAAATDSAPATVVVVADSSNDETVNAQLRAKIYSAARDQGWQAEGKADVMGKAESSGALEAGAVSRSEDKLAPLRSALGVRALVRIFRDDSGLHVIVVGASGTKSRDVASEEAALSAAIELLGRGGATKPATGGGAAATTDGTVSAGFMTRPRATSEEPEGPPPDSPEGRRLAWENRGGVRITYGARALLTGLYIPKTAFADQNPVSNQLEIGESSTFGIGGGIGAHVGMMYLPIPEPVVGSSNFAAFRLGVGAELTGLYVRPPDGYKYRVENNTVVSRDKTYDNKAYLYAFIPLELGVHFMFGEHRVGNIWRGMGLGIAYTPTLIAALEVGQDQDKTDTKFNYAGFELSLDLTKLETSERANPNIRLAATVLPKVSDDLPWLASASIGAFWY